MLVRPRGTPAAGRVAAGGPGALLLLAVLAALAPQVVALVDATRRPEEALDARGGTTLWTVPLTVALVVPGGFLLGLVHLLAVRPRGADLRS